MSDSLDPPGWSGKDGSKDCPAKQPWYIRCKIPLIIFAVVIVLIFVKWFYLRATWGEEGVATHDAMNVKLFDAPFLENCCSWWPISHFLLFFAISYFFPECWWYLIILGALWELVEVVMSFVLNKERQGARDAQSGKIEYSTDWWAGSFKDVLMNALGVLAGVMVRGLVDGALGETRDKCGRIIPGKYGFAFP